MKQFHSHNKTTELLFSVETNFSKENFSFQWSEFFSFSWFCTWCAESSAESLVSFTIHVLGATAVGKPKMACLNLPVNHRFDIFSDTLWHFLKAKNRVFSAKIRIFLQVGFFLINYSFCDVTEKNSFIWILSKKNNKIFFLKKPQKVIKFNYKCE